MIVANELHFSSAPTTAEVVKVKLAPHMKSVFGNVWWSNCVGWEK